MRAASNGAGGEGHEKTPKRKIEVKVPEWCGKWVVSMDEFADGVVGAKSKNLGGAPLQRLPLKCKNLGSALSRMARACCEAQQWFQA